MHACLSDQLEVDRPGSRPAASASPAKTPYAPKLEKDMGKNYYSKPYQDVHAMIPEQPKQAWRRVHRLS